MFNHHDISRNACMLHGPLAHHGYDWWWHSFTAQDAETGEDKPFFIEFSCATPHWRRRNRCWGSFRRIRRQESGRLT